MNEGIHVALKQKELRMPRVFNLYLFGICNIPTNTFCYTSSPTREYQPH